MGVKSHKAHQSPRLHILAIEVLISFLDSSEKNKCFEFERHDLPNGEVSKI